MADRPVLPSCLMAVGGRGVLGKDMHATVIERYGQTSNDKEVIHSDGLSTLHGDERLTQILAQIFRALVRIIHPDRVEFTPCQG